MENEKKEMNLEEFKEFVDGMKEEGLDEEDILEILYNAFEDGELDKDSLRQAAQAIGYDLNEDSDEKDDAEGGEGEFDKDQIEAAKEIGEDESKEEFQDRVAKGEKLDSDNDSDSDSEDDKDDEEERKEAMKLFG